MVKKGLGPEGAAHVEESREELTNNRCVPNGGEKKFENHHTEYRGLCECGDEGRGVWHREIVA